MAPCLVFSVEVNEGHGAHRMAPVSPSPCLWQAVCLFYEVATNICVSLPLNENRFPAVLSREEEKNMWVELN